VGGSGFLGVYVAAVTLGSARLPYRTALGRIHDSLAWLGQVAMFLVLGLLVYPSRLVGVAGVGLTLGLFLAVVARPAVVAVCLAPFGFRPREFGYIGWVGLRGAVPVILATVPVLAGAPGATHIFDVVFFIVFVNAIVPGTTVPWVTRRFGLGHDSPPPPRAVLEIESRAELDGELLSFYVDEALDVAGVPMSDIPFPEGAAATLIVRGRTLIAPKGQTALEVGDHVYVLTPHSGVPVVRLLFGAPESE
jgi:cell volume regulation protein A